MRKPLMAAGIAATIGLAGLGAGVAHAATSSQPADNPMSSLVDALATKFNLNKDDVQKVFDDNRSQMEAKREEQVKADVAQLVKDGKLTQAQADAVNTKRAELQKEHEANKESMDSKTMAERKSARDAERAALDKWANDNGIDKQYLRYVFGGHGHGGPGGPHGMMKSDSDSASSDN